MLFFAEAHRLEDNADQVDLDFGICRHEVAHYDVFEVLQIHIVRQLTVKFLGLRLVVTHQLVVFRLQLVKLDFCLLVLLLHPLNGAPCRLLLLYELVYGRLPFFFLLR